jgi:hypothetical protein
LFAERVIAVPNSDRYYDREFPHKVVQIHGPKHYPPPPFSHNQRLRTSMGRILGDSLEVKTALPPNVFE